ncbi:OLC1v1026059C1 [Oldenlandia corymbosa var. corymbosa]|uniref:OLC1v1026059C1 n=1 Tax=Oldenlandia corymbosa var. corymbosa TaxID=529605 RepID=A0AAV1C644_OLDCO|nr:OLC1v1026059C1 [Oldenlandia corymbosa var. corymbosa]
MVTVAEKSTSNMRNSGLNVENRRRILGENNDIKGMRMDSGSSLSHRMNQFVIPVKTGLDLTKYQIVMIIDSPTHSTRDHNHPNEFGPGDDFMIEVSQTSKHNRDVDDEAMDEIAALGSTVPSSL